MVDNPVSPQAVSPMPVPNGVMGTPTMGASSQDEGSKSRRTPVTMIKWTEAESNAFEAAKSAVRRIHPALRITASKVTGMGRVRVSSNPLSSL